MALFFEDDRIGMQDPIYNNQLQDQSFSNLDYVDRGTQHLPLAMPRNTRALNYNIHRDPPREWREDVDINYSNAYPQPFQRPNMLDVSGQVGEYGKFPGQGDEGMYAAKKGFQFPNLSKFMPGGILKAIGGKFKRPEQMQTAYESIMGSVNPETGRGMYKGNEYRIEDSPTGKKIFSELYPHGKNLDSWDGSKSIEEMEDEGYGSLGWAKDRLQKGKKISARLRNILERRGRLDAKNITKPGQGNVPIGPINQGTTGGGPVTTGGGGTFNPTMDPRGRRDTAASWGRATAAREAAGKQVAGPGFGRGAYWADGGRVGYQGGELVEQQTDFIQGPRGDEEFQETVVEGQAQPSREQLEALSMHIFQLPLDDLDEQQLVVVYQAAMQEQPMEEAVQEEDVQFAANGGLAGLL